MNFAIGQRVRVTNNPIALSGRWRGATGVVMDVYAQEYAAVRVRLDRGTYDAQHHEQYASGEGAWFYDYDVELLAPDDNEIDE